jgi:MFS family permease
MSNAARSKMPWLIIVAGSLVTMLAFGPRSSMGLFQLPMLSDTGWDRTDFGLAIALQNLAWGLGQPFFGALADRYGTGRVLVLSGLIYASGLVAMTWTTSVVWLYFGGALTGLGVASGSFGIVLAAFARNVTPERRSLAFGIGTAAGSLGIFLFAPLAQGVISNFGWKAGLVVMALIMLAIPLLAYPLRGNFASGTQSHSGADLTMRKALSQAASHRSYVLLVSGFFVCGFQLAFISAHFPAYLNDIGIDARYAVIAIALIGLFNVFGSLVSGYVGQRVSKPHLLTFIYLARAVAMSAFLLLPQTPASVVVFAIAMGLLWLSTVPPTNGLVAVMFGTRHLGLLSGLVFLSHQIGSFLGVWLGGYMREQFGSYDGVWWLGVALALFAAVVHWPIQESAAAEPVAA